MLSLTKEINEKVRPVAQQDHINQHNNDHQNIMNPLADISLTLEIRSHDEDDTRPQHGHETQHGVSLYSMKQLTSLTCYVIRKKGIVAHEKYQHETKD